MPEVSLLDLPGLRARESAEPGFASALVGVANELALEPSYLGAVMSLESGFRPDIVNPDGGATGLIQFMPATANLLGTTADALGAMTAIEQLDYVLAFYRRAGRAIRRNVPGDYYMATFLPAFVGKPASFVLAVKGEKIYDQNAGLDGDHDGVLTVGDVTKKIEDRVSASQLRPLAVFTTPAPAKKKTLPNLPRPSLSPPSPSSASSFGQLSAPVPGGPDMARELVVFAASCEMQDMTLLLEHGNAAGVQARIDAYWADVLHQADTAPHPKEWCGGFALWCLHQAGLGLELRWMFGPPHFGFLFNLQQTDAPQPGDIAYLDKPWQHHAIVVCVEDDVVHTIDGNQGAAEPIKTHEAPLSHWTAFFSIDSLLPTPEAA